MECLLSNINPMKHSVGLIFATSCKNAFKIPSLGTGLIHHLMCLSKTFQGTFEGLQDRLVAWNANHAHLEYETPFKKIVLEDLWKAFSPHCSNGVMHATGAWQSALQLFTLNLEPQAKVNPSVMIHDYCWRNCARPFTIREIPVRCPYPCFDRT